MAVASAPSSAVTDRPWSHAQRNVEFACRPAAGSASNSSSRPAEPDYLDRRVAYALRALGAREV